MTNTIQKKQQKYRHELIPDTKLQLYRVFVRNDLAERKIKIRRIASKKFLEFKEKSGLDPNEYSFNE